MMLIGVLLLAALFTSDVAAKPPPAVELEKQAEMEQDLGKHGSLVRGFCHDGVLYFGYCYKFVSREMTWADAELHCQTLGPGSHLVSIHFETQNFFIAKMVTEAKGRIVRTWIGLHDFFKEGAFLWTDGSSADLTKWFQGEPNNHAGNEGCGHIGWRSSILWNDAPCNNKYPFICSYKLPC